MKNCKGMFFASAFLADALSDWEKQRKACGCSHVEFAHHLLALHLKCCPKYSIHQLLDQGAPTCDELENNLLDVFSPHQALPPRVSYSRQDTIIDDGSMHRPVERNDGMGLESDATTTGTVIEPVLPIIKQESSMRDLDECNADIGFDSDTTETETLPPVIKQERSSEQSNLEDKDNDKKRTAAQAGQSCHPLQDEALLEKSLNNLTNNAVTNATNSAEDNAKDNDPNYDTDNTLDADMDVDSDATDIYLPLDEENFKKSFQEELSEALQADEIIPVPKRFKRTSPEDVDKLELASKSKKTHAMTRWGVRLYKDWLVETGRSCEFESLPEAELAAQLKVFYAEVRQRNGDPYSIQSMRSIRAALFRHLTMSPYSKTFDILKGAAFSQANNVFIGSLKHIKQQGLDHSRHHSPISASDIQQMYDSGVLSNLNPTSLLHKVFFEIMLHFGRRGRAGLRSIRKDQIVFEHDEMGREFATLCFNSLEKNHQSLTKGDTGHRQVMYGTETLHCPLKSLKLYISKLNVRCEFFQKARVVNWQQSPSWYCNSPIGVNTIAKMMSQISTAASLSQIYTNHSIRATCVTMFRDAVIPATGIMAITGHRNVASIVSYSQASSGEVRATMSNELARTGSAGVDLLPVLGEKVKLQRTGSMQVSIASPLQCIQVNEENGLFTPSSVSASLNKSSTSHKACITPPMEKNQLPLIIPSPSQHQNPRKAASTSASLLKEERTESMQRTIASPMDYNQVENEENPLLASSSVNASLTKSSASYLAYIDIPIEENQLPLSAPAPTHHPKPLRATSAWASLLKEEIAESMQGSIASPFDSIQVANEENPLPTPSSINASLTKASALYMAYTDTPMVENLLPLSAPSSAHHPKPLIAASEPIIITPTAECHY